MHILDRASSDLLACVEWDVDQTSVEHGFAEIKSRLVLLQQTVHQQRDELSRQYDIESDLKSRMAAVMEDNRILRDLSADAAENIQRIELYSENTSSELKQLLEEEVERSAGLKNRLEVMEGRYKSAIETLHGQIDKLKKELHDVITKLKISDEERDKVKSQLNQLNNNTRKLLASLDLDSQSKDTTVAVEFARSLTYVNKRNRASSTIGKHLVLANKRNMTSLSLTGQGKVVESKPVTKDITNGVSQAGELEPQQLLSRRKLLDTPSLVLSAKSSPRSKTSESIDSIKIVSSRLV